MCIFPLIHSKKSVTRENWDKPSVYFSIFEWQNLQSYQKKPLGTWQFGKIGVLVNLVIQKLKSKHLVCLSFWDTSHEPGFYFQNKKWDPYGRGDKRCVKCAYVIYGWPLV